MKFNIANPTTGSQEKIEIDDYQKRRAVFDKRISQDVSGDALGEEFMAYVFKKTAGSDKQGFPMKPCVPTPGCVCLLLHQGTPCFRGCGGRNGERGSKSEDASRGSRDGGGKARPTKSDLDDDDDFLQVRRTAMDEPQRLRAQKQKGKTEEDEGEDDPTHGGRRSRR